MVKYSQILSHNNSYFSSHSIPNLTAVFIGATNGIGSGALRAFAKHTKDLSPTIYIVGRSQQQLDLLIASISQINSSAKLIPIIAEDLTRVKSAQSAAVQIAQLASKVDLLIMTPGYMSTVYEPNGEGLDRVQTIRIYARNRFLQTLAPLLRKSPHARVVTVLAGGQEGKLFPDDLALKDNYGFVNAMNASATMNTLFLEQFALQPENANIGLVHLFPGPVGGTGLNISGLGFLTRTAYNYIGGPVMRLIGQSIEESGERVLYAATSEKFASKGKSASGDEEKEKGSDGVQGSGVYLVQPDSSAVEIAKVGKEMREQGLAPKVWKHVLDKFEEVERL